jgi:hypothetical protein
MNVTGFGVFTVERGGGSEARIEDGDRRERRKGREEGVYGRFVKVTSSWSR